MSLYTFAVWPDSAIVSADTRRSAEIDGQSYRINDHAFKLFVVDDTIVTTGGHAFLNNYIVQTWVEGEDHSIHRLHAIALEAVKNIGSIAYVIDPTGHVAERCKDDPYLLELIAVQYDKEAGHNVLWTISSYANLDLVRHDITTGRTMAYGGIRQEIVQDYINTHPANTFDSYLTTLVSAYETAANEQVGGFLSVAVQDRHNVKHSPVYAKIRDSRQIRAYIGDSIYTLCDNSVIGNNLVIQNPQCDANGTPTGVMQFKVDSTGVWLNNSTMVFQQDGGGKILMDPKYGIVAGTSSLFDTDGTTVKPGFIDDNGKIILDKDGMPEGSNFFLDLRDGSAYFRGKGEFGGILKAQDFLLPSGDSMVSILNDDKKIKGDYLDLMGINIKNNVGDTVMTIDQTGVRFGSGYSPIKTRYSTNKNAAIPGGWSETWDSGWTGSTSTEVWAIYSYDGGVTWSEPQLAQGKTGSRGPSGSDANVTRENIEKALRVASSISSSYIGVDSMGSPEIYGGAIYGTDIYAGDGSGSYAHMEGDTFSIYAGGVANPKVVITHGYKGKQPRIDLGAGDGSSHQVFSVYKNPTQGVIGYSGSGTNACYLVFDEDGSIFPGLGTSMSGIWDFSDATVKGVHATFA